MSFINHKPHLSVCTAPVEHISKGGTFTIVVGDCGTGTSLELFILKPHAWRMLAREINYALFGRHYKNKTDIQIVNKIPYCSYSQRFAYIFWDFPRRAFGVIILIRMTIKETPILLNQYCFKTGSCLNPTQYWDPCLYDVI